MKRTLSLAPMIAVCWLSLTCLCGPAIGAPPPLTPQQQEASDKLAAKGASVMQLAADSDQITVNLGIAGKGAGDAELALVKLLPNVSELDLHGTSVTDAGLSAIEGMTVLTRLHLEKTQITDAGISHLKGLTKLEYLNLYDTAISDAGISQLTELKQLKKLFLWQTKVTQAGADELKKSVPGIAINRGEELAAAPAPTPAPEAPKPTPTGKIGPEDLKLDPEGFIRTWLVLAPIPLTAGVGGAEAVDKEQLPGEKDLKPKDGDKAKAGDKELTWKSVKTADYLIDFNQMLGNVTDNSVAYVVCYIETDKELKDVQFLMGSDDQGKVFLNGREIIKATASRGLAKDQDKAGQLTLNSGTNVVVFKVVNEQGGWQGCLRLEDKSGQPLKDLKLKLNP